MKNQKRNPVGKNPEKGKRIIVAMSGGIDSSVAAAILKRAGFDVGGIFMKFWKAPGYGANRCCSLESEKRARHVAKLLKIPFYVLNFEKEFKKKIVDLFLADHRAGLTPNPCVVCNKEVKFGLLLEKSLSLGADYIATGHYARNVRDAKTKTQKLFQARDGNKDQSYFLWKLGQNQLGRVIFPIGDYTRSEVEKLAKKFKLPFSSVKKSMEVCFIPRTTADFLRKYLKMRPGKIIDADGKTLGRHDGIQLYTIGQRKGIKLSGGPYYVVGKDVKKNIIFVSKNEQDLLQREFFVKDINWISGKKPVFPLKIQVKIRYRTKSVLAKIYKIQNTKYKILFSRSQRASTPGQSAVFYKNKEVLGGGIIF